MCLYIIIFISKIKYEKIVKYYSCLKNNICGKYLYFSKNAR